jgi:ribosomal protein S18 acetylase RimI-like enzyme
VNVTGNSLVNIPLVAVEKPYRHQKLGEKITSIAVREVFKDVLDGKTEFSEINVTTDTFNTAAMRMYKYCGFDEAYQYIQSYREQSSN